MHFDRNVNLVVEFWYKYYYMNELSCKICGRKHLTGACEADDNLSEPVRIMNLKDLLSQGGEDGDDKNAGFFNVPNDPNAQPLDDEDQTPVVQMVRRNTVTELDQKEVQRRLRNSDMQAAQNRERRAEEENEAKEIEEIFRAVEEGDEDFIVGLLKRNVLNKVFNNLQEFEADVREFITKGVEFTTYIEIADLGKPTEYKSVLEIVLRPRIGNESPFVDIKIGNKIGLGKNRDRKMSEVISLEVQPQPEPKIKEEFKKTGIVKMVSSWFGGKDKK